MASRFFRSRPTGKEVSGILRRVRAVQGVHRLREGHDGSPRDENRSHQGRCCSQRHAEGNFSIFIFLPSRDAYFFFIFFLIRRSFRISAGQPWWNDFFFLVNCSQVDFDRSKHLSDASIKKRREERERLTMQMKQKEDREKMGWARPGSDMWVIVAESRLF